MLIEQIIEFEMRGPGSPGRTWIPKTGYFQDKTKISKANIRINYYLLLKILQEVKCIASFLFGLITYKI